MEKVAASTLALGLCVVARIKCCSCARRTPLHRRPSSGRKYDWIATSQALSIYLFISDPGFAPSSTQMTTSTSPVHASVLGSPVVRCSTGIPGLALAIIRSGVPERMETNLTRSEWESIQLLGKKRNLTEENCCFVWIAEAARFSSNLPVNRVLPPAPDTPRVFQFLDFYPSL